MGTERRERQRANRQLKQQEVAKQARRSHLTRRGVLIAIAAGVIFVALIVIAIAMGGDDADDAPPVTTAATETSVVTETTEAGEQTDATAAVETTAAP